MKASSIARPSICLLFLALVMHPIQAVAVVCAFHAMQQINYLAQPDRTSAAHVCENLAREFQRCANLSTGDPRYLFEFSGAAHLGQAGSILGGATPEGRHDIVLATRAFQAIANDPAAPNALRTESASTVRWMHKHRARLFRASNGR